MKKALITGISGFVGSHLTEYLLSQHVEVSGFAHPDHSIENIKHLKNRIDLKYLNLLNKKELLASLKGIDFDFVFHLAAYSSPKQSFSSAKETLENNIFVQLTLLEQLVQVKSNAKILIVGSSEQYGNIDSKYLPIKEDAPFAPESPYAVSKIAQDMLGYQFYLSENLQVVRVRPFNHIGPRQSTAFVVPAFASQIAGLEKKGGGQIKVGNLDSYRDFTDVRDIVRAYLQVLESGQAGEVYNIGSGSAVKIEDILNHLISLSAAKIKIITDKKLFRDKDIKKIYPDVSKLKQLTGWQPKIPLSKTLFDTMEYERSKFS